MSRLPYLNPLLQPELHSFATQDLDPIYRRRLLPAGCDDCWIYIGPLGISLRRVAPHAFPQRNVWRANPGSMWFRGRPQFFSHVLRDLLRPPADPAIAYLPGLLCYSSYRVVDTHTLAELDHATQGRWSRWLAKNESAEPDRVCLFCMNPNHAGYGFVKRPKSSPVRIFDPARPVDVKEAILCESLSPSSP